MSEERDLPESGADENELDLDLDEDVDGDEPDAEIEVEDEPEPQPEPKPQSRAQRRIRSQQTRIRELEDQNRRFQEAVLSQQRPAPQPQPDAFQQAQRDREELERVAAMPYEEQGRYWARKSEERMRHENQLQALQTRDHLDRIQFQGVMRDRKLAQGYGDKVEKLLAEARQNGMNPTREWLLKAVIGDEVMQRQGKSVERQRQAGQRRIASQTTRAGSASSTAAAPGGGRRGKSQAQEDDELLRGITVGDFLNSTRG